MQRGQTEGREEGETGEPCEREKGLIRPGRKGKMMQLRDVRARAVPGWQPRELSHPIPAVPCVTMLSPSVRQEPQSFQLAGPPTPC